MTDIAKHDENRVPSLLGLSSVDGLSIATAYINPSTHRLLVDLNVSDVTAINGLKDGAVVDADTQGFMALGTDGSNYQVFKVETDGRITTSLGRTLISERISNTDGTSTAFTNFSAVASTYNFITSIVVYNSSATGGYIDFRDGTAGAVLWTMPIPALGGSTMANSFPIFKTSANTVLAFDVSGALTTVYISISGYQSTSVNG